MKKLLLFAMIAVSVTVMTCCTAEDPFEEYYNNGNIKAKINYEDNLRNGDCTYYYENGKMRYQCKYKKGKRTGKATVYNDKGKKIGRLDADNY